MEPGAHDFTVVLVPFDDRGEPDDSDLVEYQYVGTYYTFRGRDQELVFRWYQDEPHVVYLSRPVEWWPSVHLGPLFLHAIEYLRVEAGISDVRLLDPSPAGKGFIPMAEALTSGACRGLVSPKR
jgi:hypothetical protein